MILFYSKVNFPKLMTAVKLTYKCEISLQLYIVKELCKVYQALITKVLSFRRHDFR